MTEDELKAIEERANAATPGSWKWQWRDGAAELKAPSGAIVLDDGSAQCEYGQIIDPSGFDAALVAHCREDIPALCAEVRRLWMVVEQYRDLLKMASPPNAPICVKEAQDDTLLAADVEENK